MISIASLARFICIVCLASSVNAQQLWVVDDDGPGDFVDVKDAVLAASDGDTILVSEGSYSPFVIDNKSLTIQGIGLPTISAVGVFSAATPSITVKNLATQQEVHLSGLRTQSLLVFELENIVLDQCEGSVTFEHCDFALSSGESVVLTDCASVTFVDCLLFASPTFPSTAGSQFLAHVPYDGIIAVDTNLFLYDCEVRGSEGADGHSQLFTNFPPGPAGAGLSLRGSSLFASGCTFIGGNAGGDPGQFCEQAQDGQPALEVGPSFATAFSSAELIDCVSIGGTGGVGGCGMPNGVDAPAQFVSAGSTLFVHPGIARSLDISSPNTQDSHTFIRVEGAPGDRALLFFSPLASPGIKTPGLPTVLHLGLPASTFALGKIPASGFFERALATPSVVGHQLIFTQLVSIDSMGTIFTSGPNTVLFIP